MDISFIVFVFCTFTDFSADDKASGVKFCTAVHRRPRQGISHFEEHNLLPKSSKSDESAWQKIHHVFMYLKYISEAGI